MLLEKSRPKHLSFMESLIETGKKYSNAVELASNFVSSFNTSPPPSFTPSKMQFDVLLKNYSKITNDLIGLKRKYKFSLYFLQLPYKKELKDSYFVYINDQWKRLNPAHTEKYLDFIKAYRSSLQSEDVYYIDMTNLF